MQGRQSYHSLGKALGAGIALSCLFYLGLFVVGALD